MTRIRRRQNPPIGAALAITALVAASVLGIASSASAHNYLVSSTPKSGSTLTTLPPEFVITTNEGLLDLSGHGAGFALQVKDSAGMFYGTGCLTVDGPAMSVPAALGAAGKYTVIWQVVSADGHVVSDTFPFTWAPPASFTPSKGVSTAPNCNGQTGGPAAQQTTTTQSIVQPKANLGLVLGIGGGIVGLGIVLTIVLLVAGRRRKPSTPAAD